MQYDMTPPRFGTRTVAGDTAKMVQKWRIHFAKPPKSTLTDLAKRVTTEVLMRNLELGEEAVRFSFSFLFYLSFNCHANAGDRTTTEAFHRSVRSRNSGLVGLLSDLAAQSTFGVYRFTQAIH